MPRTMWKGAISFGLVSIPVRLYTATEERTLRFNQLHDEDGGRIRYLRVCSACGQEVPFEHIVKGYEVEKDRYVVMTDEDFDAVPVESSRAIDILQFVDLDEIDPVFFQKSYYLVPEEVGLKAYTLLRDAMEETGRVGIAKVSFRDKEHLAALRFRGEAFVLETMFWPDEIRDVSGFDELRDAAKVKIRPQEVQMATSLVDNLTAAFDPTQFRDEYREALLGIVERKLAGETIEVPAEEPTSRVVDLMEALKASVEATKGRAEAEPAKKPARKRSEPGARRKKAAS